MSEKMSLKFQMSEQYWGCLDKMSEVNFSPAETLLYSGLSAPAKLDYLCLILLREDTARINTER